MTIKFNELSASYPIDHDPCATNGAANFEDQCAIRMGLCLKGGGVLVQSFTGARCWFGHGRDHTIRAQELANWLKEPAQVRAFDTCTFKVTKRERGQLIDVTSFAGIKGIVFFRHFWGPGNQGNHIDLWDGVTPRTGSTDYFGRSEEVWSWSMS